MGLSRKEGKRLAQAVAILRREERRPVHNDDPTTARLVVRAEVAKDSLLSYLLDAKVYGDDPGAAHAWELDKDSPVAPDREPAPDASH